jgi:hypothetical protein
MNFQNVWQKAWGEDRYGALLKAAMAGPDMAFKRRYAAYLQKHGFHFD